MSDMARLNALLNKFHTEHGIPSDGSASDVHKALGEIRKKAGAILRYIAKKDRRFDGEFHDVGSLTAGVATGSFDECDMMLPLAIEGRVVKSSTPGFAKFKLNGDALDTWTDCATTDGYLQPRVVADKFYEYVEEALKKQPFPELSLSGKGSVAATISMRHSLYQTIDIDLVVAVKCIGLPIDATADWLQEGSRALWPKKSIVDDIKKNGFELVAKPVFADGPAHTAKDEELISWRISFAIAETYLITQIDYNNHVTQLCHKKCLRLLKAIRNLYFSTHDKHTTSTLKSHHLKILLFHECTMHPSNTDWPEERLAERFMSIVKNLLISVQTENLPDFFMPKLNLFNLRGVKPLEPKISRLYKDPTMFLKK